MMSMTGTSSMHADSSRWTVGWDIGGAHVKAALLDRGELVDAAQWPCPLWQGLQHLDAALAAALQRWPVCAHARHAVTMTGEMVDLFLHREEGVARIAAALAAALPQPRFFAGDAGWCDAHAARAHWQQVASANWLATAQHMARALAPQSGLLIDIGSTTTDVIAFAQGRVLTAARSDRERLASGELVYHGVVRTPLCALAPRIPWRGVPHNVMNEFFATTADVYRLTGELDTLYDQHPSADGGAKTTEATRARLARMIGLDARDGSSDDWLAFAQTWRAAQCDTLRRQIAHVIERHALGGGAVAVAAGCGAFLVAGLVPAPWQCLHYGRDVVRVAAPTVARWAQVAAPAAAVAALALLTPPVTVKAS
jgi:(4-(4-[2-(gamma-L-glutamylamino)ethyl]phenoxymethyl)furan-2-yl)methanamine synthase